MSPESVDAVAEYFAALRANDPEAWSMVFAPDAEGHDPVGTPVLRGRPAFETMLTGFLEGWSRFDGLTEDDRFSSGEAVGVRWHAGGASHSGEEIAFSGITLFFIGGDSGLIVRFYSVFDAAAVGARLAGVPTSPPDR
jgi:steroid delta-isomerase